MKSPTAYYLLLLYTTLIIKPLFPVIIDWYSHEFNEIEHLTKVHAVYGSHHLQKELTETTSDNHKNQNTLRAEDQVPWHLSTETFKYVFLTDKTSIQFPLFRINKISFIPVSIQGPPPKFS